MKRNGELIHVDEWGNEYVLDEKGNRQKPRTAPESSKKTSSGFTCYDAPGYCSLCGRMECRGGCFR
jgi:hypothetical protein